MAVGWLAVLETLMMAVVTSVLAMVAVGCGFLMT